MNLVKLFEMQRVLDERIIKEKGLEGKDLFPGTILALLMELGELANELPEYTKHWSNKKNNTEKALEEYVDCLHFILSLGNQIDFKHHHLIGIIKSEYDNIVEAFLGINDALTLFRSSEHEIHYSILFEEFLLLGEMLGFPWEEIEIAYYTKNAINHARQGRGY